ncbi:MAG: DUF2933 domain-containing protein [Actinomycetota bacterium]
MALTGVVVVAITLFRLPLATIFTLGLLLVCPLLMMGMHGGGHGEHGSDRTQQEPKRPLGEPLRGIDAPETSRRGFDSGPSANQQRQEVQR